MERSLVAKVGSLVFVLAIGLPAVLSSASARASVLVASVADDDAATPIELAQIPVAYELPEMRIPRIARENGTGSSGSVQDPAPAPEPVAPPPNPRPATVVVATVPPAPPLVLDGTVIASWYGPGFYGNRTACGQTYTPEVVGVAHRTLPCGTPIRITSPAGITVVVPVIDRGPYIAGRTLDLSNATRIALQCSDLCRVRMTVVQ